MKLRNIGIILLLIGLFAFLTVCDKKADTKGIELNVTLLPKALTDFLYVKMNYGFSLSEKFEGINESYRVYVHFWRVKNKEMLFVDDHRPEKKIAEWKKGDKINYSRVIFIPRFLDEFDIDFEGLEEIKLTVGLYDPAVKESKIILYEETLNIQSASLNAPEIVYDEGWHQSETDLKIKNEKERNWRWTAKRAVCIIENPKKECLLKLRGGVDKAKFEDQKVIFKINDKLLEEFIPETAKFFKDYIITPEMMGEEDEFKLTIETDKTFVPSALDPDVDDARELGVQIFFFYFRENIK